jgi:hypothetical protein
MSKEIEKWLKNPKDYQKGVELLSTVCKNKVLINNLIRKESAANKERLIYQLEKHAVQPAKATKPKPQPKPKPKALKTAPTQTDQTLERLSEEKGQLHLERARAANRMKFCTNDAQRKQVYENCQEIQARYDAKAKQITHYQRHGTLPKEESVKTTTFRLSDDRMDWRKQLSNARSNRSKLTNKIKAHSQDHPKQAIWKKKLNQIIKDIEQIENHLQSQQTAAEAGAA